MNKIVLLYTGWEERAKFFTKSLEKYFEVVLVGIPKGRMIVELEPPIVNFQDIRSFDFLQYNPDLVLGLDHGCVLLIKHLKDNKLINCKAGSVLLDWPEHIFINNKDYTPNIIDIWNNIIDSLSYLDFALCNRFNILQKISEKISIPIGLFENAMTIPKDFEKQPLEDFIVYSAAVNPTKGLHYLIDALGILGNHIPLLVISYTGSDLSGYAKYLNVNMKQIGNITPEEKFKYYYKSRFIVAPTDNSFLPPGSAFEALCIGKSAIVFDYLENRRSYRDSVEYVSPINIKELSDKIKFWYDNPEIPNKLGLKGPAIYEKYWTYEVWSKKVNEFIFNILK